eukprot:scaffold3674_cov51-Attheya_sp.AAC.2
MLEEAGDPAVLEASYPTNAKLIRAKPSSIPVGMMHDDVAVAEQINEAKCAVVLFVNALGPATLLLARDGKARAIVRIWEIDDSFRKSRSS